MVRILYQIFNMKEGKMQFYRQKAYTLAEVLITLGIVGVVAALTIPQIITNYQKQVTATRLKHAYSVLSQAIEMAEAHNGSIQNWTYTTGDEAFEKYLKPHIKTLKTETFRRNGVLGITYKQLSGIPETGLAMMGNGAGSMLYSLQNGTQIFFNKWNSTIIHIIIDINGDNGPNQFGKDVFYFLIDKTNKLYPMGYRSTTECRLPQDPNTDRDLLKNGTCCNYGCSKKKRGTWCGALIMVDGWKIAPDYPW